ncbi:helix-turn-helix domain-containing protein [Nocardia otitidiscaviarum]|nr:helix-turn-helix domain-containing protein [Nocardia otitidiscaviarum]
MEFRLQRSKSKVSENPRAVSVEPSSWFLLKPHRGGHRMAAPSTLPRILLGLELKALREGTDIRMDEAAIASGMSKPTLWRIETGQDVRLNHVLIENALPGVRRHTQADRGGARTGQGGCRRQGLVARVQRRHTEGFQPVLQSGERGQQAHLLPDDLRTRSAAHTRVSARHQLDRVPRQAAA